MIRSHCYTFLVFLLTVAATCSCSTQKQKEEAIKNFSVFIENVEKNMHNYSDNDWNEADKTYSTHCSILDERFRKNMSTDEKDTVNRLKGKYLGLKMKWKACRSMEQLHEKANDAIQQAEGFFETFK